MGGSSGCSGHAGSEIHTEAVCISSSMLMSLSRNRSLLSLHLSILNPGILYIQQTIRFSAFSFIFHMISHHADNSCRITEVFSYSKCWWNHAVQFDATFDNSANLLSRMGILQLLIHVPWVFQCFFQAVCFSCDVISHQSHDHGLCVGAFLRDWMEGWQEWWIDVWKKWFCLRYPLSVVPKTLKKILPSTFWKYVCQNYSMGDDLIWDQHSPACCQDLWMICFSHSFSTEVLEHPENSGRHSHRAHSQPPTSSNANTNSTTGHQADYHTEDKV